MKRRLENVIRLRGTPKAPSLVMIVMLAGCPNIPLGGPSSNPFVELPAIPLDGRAREMTSGVASLGRLAAESVVRLRVTGSGIETVLLLTEDALLPGAGVVVGGGPVGEFFETRVGSAGVYLVLALFESTLDESLQQATIEALPGDAGLERPATQAVLVSFEEDYLTGPGLYDPTSSSANELAFLESISELVQSKVIDSLRAIFAGTPIEIVTGEDPAPSGAYSRLIFTGQRVLSEQTPNAVDSVVPITADPACNQGVVFGELLPAGTRRRDPGNHTGDDEAVVYVGSFQGRGPACQSAVIDSINNIVLALSHTGAHEIGHLVGLFHVASFDDIMVISPNLAFQRELLFARSQLQLGSNTMGGTVFPVLTNVIQDPAVYFAANFGG